MHQSLWNTIKRGKENELEAIKKKKILRFITFGCHTTRKRYFGYEDLMSFFNKIT